MRTGATMSRPSSKSASGDERQRDALRVRVGRAVRDEGEGGPAETDDLERRLDVAPVRRDRAHHGAREREVAGTPAVGAPPHLVHPSHRLGVEADACREGEAPAVDACRARSAACGRARSRPRPARAARQDRAAARARAAGRSCLRPAGSRSARPRASPFSASLKPPSPEKTTTASLRLRQASVTSSVAWPGRSVRSVSTSPTRPAPARTAASPPR